MELVKSTRRSIGILERSAETKRLNKRCENLESKANALRDALRWATAALVIADEEFTRLNGHGSTPRAVTNALDDSKQSLHRISSHRINSKQSTVFSMPS